MHVLIFFFTSIFYTPFFASQNQPITENIKYEKNTITLDYCAPSWDSLLKKYVSATGKVDYKGFKKDIDALNTYVSSLSDNPPTESTSKTERMVYWINAYNAVTVQLIASNYPLSSITKLDAGKTWDVKRFRNGDKKMSLNDIENTILRPLNDPRIHFALNCAAKSCPPLLNQAFTTDNLETLLEERTKSFINTASRTTLSKTDIKVSKIFDWYGKDFGSIINFINKYANTKVLKTANMTYLEYDWSLNE